MYTYVQIAKKRPEIRYAFEIHAFIQRGSGNPAWQEKCYEKWMGQFSISQRPGPGAAAIFVHYTPTCMHLEYVQVRVHSSESARPGNSACRCTRTKNHKRRTAMVEGEREERRARTRCWLYQQALDLDEVKYKLSLLVCSRVSPPTRYRDCVLSGSSSSSSCSNFSIIYSRFDRGATWLGKSEFSRKYARDGEIINNSSV